MYTCEVCDHLITFGAHGEPLCSDCNPPPVIRPEPWWHQAIRQLDEWLQEMAS